MSNDEADKISNPTPISVDEPFVEVISEDEDETLTPEQKALLRYKHKVKRIFREPKFSKLTEQIGKLERSLSEKRSKKVKDQQPNLIKGKQEFSRKPIQDSESLSTPSELLYAPSDFEHVFHAQNETGKERVPDKKELQREQEMLAKIFERMKIDHDPVIPIYTGDDSMKTKVINIPLARLNELIGQKEAAIKMSKQKTTPMPMIRPFINTPIPQLKPSDKSLKFIKEGSQQKQVNRSLSPNKLLKKKESSPKSATSKSSSSKSMTKRLIIKSPSKSVTKQVFNKSPSKSMTKQVFDKSSSKSMTKQMFNKSPSKPVSAKSSKSVNVKTGSKSTTLRALLLKEIKRTYK